MWQWILSVYLSWPWWVQFFAPPVILWSLVKIGQRLRQLAESRRRRKAEEEARKAEQEWIDLDQAAVIPSVFDEGAGQIKVLASGAGLFRVKVELKGTMEFPLRIPLGTRFAPATSCQNMVSVTDYIVLESAQEETPPYRVIVDIPAACLQMHEREPSSRDYFTAYPPVRSGIEGDLQALFKHINLEPAKADTKEPLSEEDKLRATFQINRVIQFAIWVITDDPSPDQFLSIGGAGPPTASEIAYIKQLFKRAGIRTYKYRAFA
jgi:hypothetical protein